MAAQKLILVIDDEESVRKSFLLALEDHPYKIETAASGQLGISAAKKTRFDLIFCDLKMPGLNGVETVRELRKKDKTVPIYIVTAFSKEFASELKGLEKDDIAFELLSKPLGSDQIIAVVDAALNGLSTY